MPVRNQKKKGGQGVYPIRHPSAMSFGLPEHNPQPSTTRGRRRSANTEEYQKNLLTRQKQGNQHAPTMPQVRGPCKMPSLKNHDDVVKYIQNNARYVKHRPR